MIGKSIIGKSFVRCVRYVVNKPEAKILFAEGIRMQHANAIIQDFNLQRKMRPKLGKAVGHLILSWSKEDLLKLSDKIMVERAKEYMEKVGIGNTQFLVVRHNDCAHPHLHLIYNRVDNNGMTISDKFNFAKNNRACKEIKLMYGYYFGKGKDTVNRSALRGKEKIRYELYDAIKASMKTATNWKQMEARLDSQGITVAYKFCSDMIKVQGVSFRKGNIKMKGSSVDRSMTFARINTTLNRNQLVKQFHIARGAKDSILADELLEKISQSIQMEYRDKPDIGEGILINLIKLPIVAELPVPVINEYLAHSKRKNKKRNIHSQK